jgi:hypothetical protein
LTLGDVRIVPEDARPAWGTIDLDGRFTLKTFDPDDGVVLGTHHAAIRAAELLSPTQMKWHAPKKYADEQTSGLMVTIDGPNDELTINLTWDGGKPFVERLVNGQWR